MTGSVERSSGDRSPRERVNPFVGPRPLERGEKLWGRDREVRELDDILSAERIVLLCSPSGAGKSSLVQAGLVPRMKKAFDIWGPTRVHQELPGGVDANRYVLSTIAGFEEGVPERLRRPVGELASQSLEDYVEHRPHRRSAPQNKLLIFDQFEEILTADPLAQDAKREFFEHLGRLLRRPEIWALFALREDYLAALDPFAEQVPTHLRHRYRIDLLHLAGARAAIERPASEAGREILVAERLVEDLATVKVQQHDGSFVEKVGFHVEPVQLQVVCRRLWNALPPDATSIDEEDLVRFGDVGAALASYYSDAAERTAKGDRGLQRRIRTWFGERLITAEGIRGQVLMGAGESEGLDNRVIRELLDTHLVRAENRAGSTWFELAHDRLIEPIRKDNTAWRAKNLSEFQQRAELWERQGRPTGLVLQSDELDAALRKAEESVAITPTELAFLEASQKLHDQEREKARKTRWIRRLGFAALAFGIVAAVFSVVAWRARLQAEDERAKAEGLRIEAQTQSDLALQQSREAYRQKQIAVEERDTADLQRQLAEQKEKEAAAAREQAAQERAAAEREKERALQAEALAVAKEQEAASERDKALAAEDLAREQQEQAQEARVAAIESEREARRLHLLAEAETLAATTLTMHQESQHDLAALLAIQAYRIEAAQGGKESPQVYHAMRRALDYLGSHNTILAHQREIAIRALAFLPPPEESELVSGSDDGEVLLLHILPDGVGPVGRLLEGGRGDSIRTLAAGDDGRLLAGTLRGNLYAWDRERRRNFASPRTILSQGPPIAAVDVDPDDPNRFAVGRGGGVEIGLGEEVRSLWPSLADRVYDVAWGPKGLLAAGTNEGALIGRVTDLEEPTTFKRLETSAEVLSVSVAASGDLVAAGTGLGLIYVWRLDPENEDAQSVVVELDEPLELRGHTARIADLEFLLDPWKQTEWKVVASASFDADVRIWGAIDSAPTYDWTSAPVPSLILQGHEDWVRAVRFASAGDQIASGDSGGILRVWPKADLIIEQICRIVSRDLSDEERRLHLPETFRQTPTCEE